MVITQHLQVVARDFFKYCFNIEQKKTCALPTTEFYVRVIVNMQRTKSKKSFTHVRAQSFNVLAPLSDHSSSILKLQIENKQLPKNTSPVEQSDLLSDILSYCSVRGLTLLCNNTRSSTMSSDFRERLYVGSSSMSWAGRLPGIHKYKL